MERLVVVDGEARGRELVNLEMVRIKSHGEQRRGLEVFLQDGRYGVMRNGRVTCPARFKTVKRLQESCGFFALGTYTVQAGTGAGGTQEVTTVIDRRGQDLRVTLYGRVAWCDGYFCGEISGKGYARENSWDPVGNAYYEADPCFTRVAGVEVGVAREHDGARRPCMRLRMSTGRVSPRFNVGEMFYNRDIIVARDYLVVKRDRNHAYRIRAFLGDSVLVEPEDSRGYQQVMTDGSMGKLYGTMPQGATRAFNAVNLGLKRVKEVRP